MTDDHEHRLEEARTALARRRSTATLRGGMVGDRQDVVVRRGQRADRPPQPLLSVESRLRMDPRTKDYALVGGEDYRRGRSTPPGRSTFPGLASTARATQPTAAPPRVRRRTSPPLSARAQSRGGTARITGRPRGRRQRRPEAPRAPTLSSSRRRRDPGQPCNLGAVGDERHPGRVEAAERDGGGNREAAITSGASARCRRDADRDEPRRPSGWVTAGHVGRRGGRRGGSEPSRSARRAGTRRRSRQRHSRPRGARAARGHRARRRRRREAVLSQNPATNPGSATARRRAFDWSQVRPAAGMQTGRARERQRDDPDADEAPLGYPRSRRVPRPSVR